MLSEFQFQDLTVKLERNYNFSQKTNGRGSFEVDNKSVKCLVSSLTDGTHSKNRVNFQ